MTYKRTFVFILFALALLACAFVIEANTAFSAVDSLMKHADILASFGGTSALTLGVGSLALSGDNHAAKSKFFRVAIEGATTDGRVIPREWIEQAAKNYSRNTYGARVNMEHIRGIYPDSPFKAYGDVLALKAEEVEINGVKKLALFAEIEPTAELVAMVNKAKQKIYTSCEFRPKFADTGEAYLIGLAVTDNPASLGTEVMTFAAQKPASSPFASRKQAPDDLFTAAEETVIELANEAAPPALFSRVKELLGLVKKSTDASDTRFADITQAVEVLATHSREQADIFTKQTEVVAQLVKKVGDQTAQADKDREAFTALQTQLAKTPGSQVARPAATGITGAVALTDC